LQIGAGRQLPSRCGLGRRPPVLLLVAASPGEELLEGLHLVAGGSSPAGLSPAGGQHPPAASLSCVRIDGVAARSIL